MNLSKIIYYICLAFAGSIILLIVVSIIPVPGNFKVLTVLSGSMEPTIKVGSVIVVKPSEDYKIDDIITFSRSEDSEVSTTHRIVKIEIEDGKTLYTVKGDANKAADIKKVSSENVVGKALFSIPFLGYLLNFAKQPIGFVLLIWVPAIIIIWEEIGKIRKELKKKSEKPNAKPESKVEIEARTQVRKQTQIQDIKISKTASNIGPKIIILKNEKFKNENKNKIEKTKLAKNKRVKRATTGKENKK